MVSAFSKKNDSVLFTLVEMAAIPIKIIKKAHTHTQSPPYCCLWFNASFCLAIVLMSTSEKNKISRHSLTHFLFNSIRFSTHIFERTHLNSFRLCTSNSIRLYSKTLYSHAIHGKLIFNTKNIFFCSTFAFNEIWCEFNNGMCFMTVSFLWWLVFFPPPFKFILLLLYFYIIFLWVHSPFYLNWNLFDCHRNCLNILIDTRTNTNIQINWLRCMSEKEKWRRERERAWNRVRVYCLKIKLKKTWTSDTVGIDENYRMHKI